MTRTQRKNLKKLRDYLSGPLHEGSEFDMERYAEASGAADAATECGSVGCAIGHGPYAGIRKYAKETWREYGVRAYSADWSLPATRDQKYQWAWLFDPLWAKCFPTKDDAVKRIDAFLQYGSVQKLVDRQDELDTYTLEMVATAEEMFKDSWHAKFPKRTQDISGDYE